MSFAGFREARLPGARPDVEIFARIGGEGPPLLLLHGYPQTHLTWRKVAPLLAGRFTVICADLRGYGASSAPADDAEHVTYSKREMARDMAAAMASLGHERFRVAGHDRGARAAYRMALDLPERVARMAAVEIAPTYAYWREFDADAALKLWHWTFLAQPAPLPETMLGGDPRAVLAHFLSRWSRSGTLDHVSDALDAYADAFAARLPFSCADYRAGATIDRALDEADVDAGRTIAAPSLLIAGAHGFPARLGDPAALWRDLAPNIAVAPVESGHFAPEEAPDAVAAALTDFMEAA